MRKLRVMIVAGTLGSLVAATGCNENSPPPKSFSQNISAPAEKVAGKPGIKPKGQNKQVRSFTVPDQ